jgi:hypothetical protein
MPVWLKRTLIIGANIVVVVALLSGLEVYARLTEPPPAASPKTPMFPNDINPGGDNFSPYVMSLASSKEAPSSPLLRNNFGFTTKQTFDLTTPYQKQPNEKVIAFLGGSAGWGYGASSNDKIVHQRIEAILNERQSEIHYTVVSLAMQGWIAQQSAVALDIWGRLFRPDWVISMSGFNDAVVGCLFSQGTGNTNHLAAMRVTLLGAYQAALGRSGFEQTLISDSALYRRISGKSPLEREGRKYITKTLFADPAWAKALGVNAFVTTPLSDVRNQVRFYLWSMRSIIERYPEAKVLATTEAMSRDFDAIFSPSADDLEKTLNAAIEKQPMCAPETGETARRYVFASADHALEKIVAEYQSKRREVEYFNMGNLFPRDNETRIKDFLDDVHLRDSGHEKLANWYASKILSKDLPAR